MAALPFSGARIAELVLRFNAMMMKEGADIPDLVGNAWDDDVVATLQETAGDLGRDEITQEIESMNDEQEDTLCWIGRGDSEPDDWEQTNALAQHQHERLVSRYPLGQPEAGEFLTKGLEKRLDQGVD